MKHKTKKTGEVLLSEKDKVNPRLQDLNGDFNMEFTGERYVPGKTDVELQIEHETRYQFASHLVKSKRTLDAACGTGFGTQILSDVASTVIGIDISDEAIEYAKQHYQNNSNISFQVASIQNLPFEDNSFDVIVSFETIEHVDEIDQRKFLSEIKRLLVNDDGLLIMSTPNLTNYDKRGVNEWHIKEFELKEFKEFLSKYFKHIQLLSQQFEVCNVLVSEEVCSDVVTNGYSLENSEYIIALCSDKLFTGKTGQIHIRNDKKFHDLVEWSKNIRHLNEAAQAELDTAHAKLTDTQLQLAEQAQFIKNKEGHIELLLESERILQRINNETQTELDTMQAKLADVLTTGRAEQLALQNRLEETENRYIKRTGKFYFDVGEGYTENDAISFSFDTGEGEIKQEINLPENTKNIHFAPVEGLGCIVQNLEILSTKGFVKFDVLNGIIDDGNILFTTTDPQILIANLEGLSWLKIRCRLVTFSEFEFFNVIDTYKKKMAERDVIQVEMDSTRAERESIRAELATTRAEREATQVELGTMQTTLGTMQAELNSKQVELTAMMNNSREEQLAWQSRLEETENKYTKRFGKFYFDVGDGYTENDAISFSFDAGDSEIIQEINVPENVNSICFEPVESAGCVLRGLEILSPEGFISFEPINGFAGDDGEIIFATADPKLIIDIGEKSGIIWLK
ncbi:MAG: methyltransferase domain-containing protein, partial [Tannerella sp.]|nr:methyltransferase domain-containing protein [Tannerella sp.]